MTVSDLSVALDPATVRRTTLPNGLRVLVRRDASAPVVAIVTYVSAGYFDETDDVIGIAHVLEHMYFKGTPTRGVGEIARQTKAVGGYLNAATIYDHTSYYTVLPSSSFAAGLDVQFDAYANSLIDSVELAGALVSTHASRSWALTRRSTALTSFPGPSPIRARVRSTVVETAACGEIRVDRIWWAPSRSASMTGGSSSDRSRSRFVLRMAS